MVKKLYDNYTILHPDGTIMFLCSEKRFNWYVNKKLATLIDDITAKLTFMPAGYGSNSPDRDGLLPKSNICVVCGTPHDLTYHHVVPYMYKSLMPDKCKEHNSYDVMPLCEPCHRSYEKEATIFKNTLQNIYIDEDFALDEYYLNQGIKSFRTIESYGHLIPIEKLEILEDNIKTAEDRLNIDRAEFESLILPSTAQKVLDTLGIHQLVISFRLHFLNITEPKFLPDWYDCFNVNMYDYDRK